MDKEEMIVNRVATSPLRSIDLEDFLSKESVIGFDLKDVLFQGIILKEKDFRTFVKEHDWSQYDGKNVRLFCSVDAIIPTWAYMLLVVNLQAANLVIEGSEDDMEKGLISQAVGLLMEQDWAETKVVIKGCGDIRNKEFAYTELAKALVPVVSSLMYGEPCSTVPVYKKKK